MRGAAVGAALALAACASSTRTERRTAAESHEAAAEFFRGVVERGPVDVFEFELAQPELAQPGPEDDAAPDAGPAAPKPRRPPSFRWTHFGPVKATLLGERIEAKAARTDASERTQAETAPAASCALLGGWGLALAGLAVLAALSVGRRLARP